MKSVGQKFRVNEGSAKMAVLGLVLCAVLLAGCASFEQTPGASPGKTAAGVAPASAPQITGVLGSPSATTTIEGNQLPPPAPKFGGKIERNALQSTPWWPPRVVPPKGAPNVLLIMTDDQGFARPQHLRRGYPDTGARSHRQQRPALHQLPFGGGVLGDARGAHHRAQPSRDGLRRRLGSRDRLPRLQQHHDPGQGDHRQNPQGQRLPHLLVRQGPQHAGFPGEPGRALRPVADRHGV